VRPGFGWVVRPAVGSVLASPEPALWDPAPDYFHHWVRDAAVAVRVLPEVLEVVDEAERDWWLQAFRDHVRFSLRIGDPSRRGPERNPLAATAKPELRWFLRPDAELRKLSGSGWLEEPRFAADGGPDLERWNRPQDDGPALRASACMAVVGALPELAGPDVEALVRRDLDHVERVAGRPCIGPWEDGPERRTLFTLVSQWDALDRGGRCEAAADVMRQIESAARPVWPESLEAPDELDSGAVLGVLHAGREGGVVGMASERVLGTVEALEGVFREIYPINVGRGVPAMGRFRGDEFFGGNPWYPVTLGFAELHYRIAALRGDLAAFSKAEAWMELIREVAPDGDALPEQFDRVTGKPVSTGALTWSAAAFVGAAAARERCVGKLFGDNG
jgi:glucoamylase